MKIIRGRLNPADVSNPTLRYNSDCDCIQQTPDGGATWVDVPQADPRHAVGFLKPPVAGDNKRCDAAANMVKWLKDFIDSLNAAFATGATIATFVNILMEFMDLLFPYAELLQLVVEAAGTLFGIGHAALSAAFGSTEYDALLCIFYCRADTATGRISADNLVLVESDVTAQLNTTAALVVNAILFMQGEIGLSNAGVIGGQTGDCTACDCAWCYVFDADHGWAGWTVEAAGIYTGGELASNVWRSTLASDGTGTTQVLGIQVDIPANLTQIEVFWIAETTANGAGRSMATQPDNTVIQTIPGFAGSNSTEWDGTLDDVTVAIRIDSIASGCCNYITKVVMRGNGDNPFGDTDC